MILHLGGESWAGLADGGELHVGTVDGPKRRVDRSNPIGLLPCLEHPYAVARAEVEMREAALGRAGGSLLGLVPLAGIPIAAVSSRQPYWAELALSWLADMPPTEAARTTLRELMGAHWASQRVRHRAKKILREVDDRPEAGGSAPGGSFA